MVEAAGCCHPVAAGWLWYGPPTRVMLELTNQSADCLQAIHECAPRAKDCTHRCCRYKNHVDEAERAKTGPSRRCDPKPNTYPSATHVAEPGRTRAQLSRTDVPGMPNTSSTSEPSRAE
jgi:hypothetical protein